MGFHDQTLPSSAPILGGLLLTPLEPSGQFGFCRGLGSKTFVAMSEVQGDFFLWRRTKVFFIIQDNMGPDGNAVFFRRSRHTEHPFQQMLFCLVYCQPSIYFCSFELLKSYHRVLNADTKGD